MLLSFIVPVTYVFPTSYGLKKSYKILFLSKKAKKNEILKFVIESLWKLKIQNMLMFECL